VASTRIVRHFGPSSESIFQKEISNLKNKILNAVGEAATSKNSSLVQKYYDYFKTNPTSNPEDIEDYNNLDEVTLVDKNTKPEDIKDEDPKTVKTAIEKAKKSNKPVGIAEEQNEKTFTKDEVYKILYDFAFFLGQKDGQYLPTIGPLEKWFPKYMSKFTSLNEKKETDNDDEKEPTIAQINKKDSVSTLVSKYRETTSLMKSLAKQYQSAEGKEKEKIKEKLKNLTKVKKELEALL
jgi:hypothetical protein